MSGNRSQAVSIAVNRSKNRDILSQSREKISTYFGQNVFTPPVMETYLSSQSFHMFQQAIQESHKLSRRLADEVAQAMMNWAMEKGATHYAHWFQPLTGKTAEKHDSFFTLSAEGNAIEEFSGNELAQQEPDGSSFPGGGLRSTFEARGYTAWDPTSPAFLLENNTGITLCIPTIFVTYSGEALDYKLPLLKSVAKLEEAAIPICKFFDEKVTKVITTLGWEQEYFLVDEALYNARPDLYITGRTLVGKSAPKGQQLDDHYFGSIPNRVYAYMRDLEIECHKLGIPVRTRHNEVGPGQFELAPMFEEVNVAIDHNQLLMDLMDKIARKHQLRILLHEKPYNNVNGSGKHNNWSISTGRGKNLLSPGKDPGKNLRFLTFFVNTIRAVYDHADLLRASVASASNDHRLGANEAPPAIISIFIGDTLFKILKNIAHDDGEHETSVRDVLDLLSKIPELEKDNTDRNRTSPFAFTGNKFEIRMVGSSMNCAAPMTVMNTIVAQRLVIFRDEVNEWRKNEDISIEDAMLGVLKKYILESENILFEGDGYSEDWEKEAEKRGLNNLKTSPDALGAYISESSKSLFASSKILSAKELEAHYDVKVENYILNVQIESRTLGEMCYSQILPVAIEYQNKLTQNISGLKGLGLGEEHYSTQLDTLKRISQHVSVMKDKVNQMTTERKLANEKHGIDCARHYCNNVLPLMEEIRIAVDRIEYLVDDQMWPLVKYRELMFLA